MAWLVFALVALPARAEPPGPATFCSTYPSAPACIGTQPACTYCHTSPPTLNPYGQAVSDHLLTSIPKPRDLTEAQYTQGLPDALHAVEALDSDGDGFSNLTELQAGTFPGVAASVPTNTACNGGRNPQFNVCQVDLAYAYRKLLLDFCGTSPTFEGLQTFKALPAAQQTAQLDTTLTSCLLSEFWRAKDGQLWQVAHPKIRPVGSLKDGPEDRGVVPLADYYDDYNLFVWSQSGGHDARDILVGSYFVSRQVSGNPAHTSYAVITDEKGSGLQQDVVPERRAGQLTSKWDLVFNVMFSPLPRIAAAQAYRGYLGLDIAKQEGLYPIAGEPKDYDNRGVTQATCSQCHATLDPLSYPFKNYNGLTPPKATYDATRYEDIFADFSPNILLTPEAGYIFGQPVNDLLGWTRVAASSDPFSIATVSDYWNLVLGAPPTSEQEPEFQKLWQDFKANGHDVEKMLHALVHTEAYDVP